ARFGAVLCGAIASVTVGPVPLFAATATGSFQVGATVAANCAITAEDDVNNAVRVISLRCINPPSYVAVSATTADGRPVIVRKRQPSRKASQNTARTD